MFLALGAGLVELTVPHEATEPHAVLEDMGNPANRVLTVGDDVATAVEADAPEDGGFFDRHDCSPW